MSSIISSNIDVINQAIKHACLTSTPPRNDTEVSVIAVCKRQPIELVQQAYKCGLLDFGENYVQEVVKKCQNGVNHDDIRWHLIGPLQSNKTKIAAKLFSWVHTIDRVKIAQRLSDARLEAKLEPINICIQINLNDEEQKSGIHPNQLPELLEACHKLNGLQLRGLMCILKANLSEQENKDCFIELKNLFDQSKTTYPTLDTLSMGMSSDYVQAIQAGATMIRIGTAIFGQRQS